VLLREGAFEIPQPLTSGLVLREGVPLLGTSATAADVETCYAHEAHKRSRPKHGRGSAKVVSVDVELHRLYNAVQAKGGWPQVRLNGSHVHFLINNASLACRACDLPRETSHMAAFTGSSASLCVFNYPKRAQHPRFLCF
jgi:hypothetical protein